MINNRIEHLKKEIKKFENRLSQKNNVNIEYDKGYLCKLENELHWLLRLKEHIESLWDGDSYTDDTLKYKVSEINITKLLGVDNIV